MASISKQLGALFISTSLIPSAHNNEPVSLEALSLPPVLSRLKDDSASLAHSVFSFYRGESTSSQQPQNPISEEQKLKDEIEKLSKDIKQANDTISRKQPLKDLLGIITDINDQQDTKLSLLTTKVEDLTKKEASVAKEQEEHLKKRKQLNDQADALSLQLRLLQNEYWRLLEQNPGPDGIVVRHIPLDTSGPARERIENGLKTPGKQFLQVKKAQDDLKALREKRDKLLAEWQEIFIEVEKLGELPEALKIQKERSRTLKDGIKGKSTQVDELEVKIAAEQDENELYIKQIAFIEDQIKRSEDGVQVLKIKIKKFQ